MTVVASPVATATSGTRASFLVTAAEAGKLDAWIDFNRDGDWLDESEQLFPHPRRKPNCHGFISTRMGTDLLRPQDALVVINFLYGQTGEGEMSPLGDANQVLISVHDVPLSRQDMTPCRSALRRWTMTGFFPHTPPPCHSLLQQTRGRSCRSAAGNGSGDMSNSASAHRRRGDAGRAGEFESLLQKLALTRCLACRPRQQYLKVCKYATDHRA